MRGRCRRSGFEIGRLQSEVYGGLGFSDFTSTRPVGDRPPPTGLDHPHSSSGLHPAISHQFVDRQLRCVCESSVPVLSKASVRQAVRLNSYLNQ